MTKPPDHDVRMGRARLSLDGLSVGDAFGERFFCSPTLVEALIESRAVPAAPWRWTDDTAMAVSIVEALDEHGAILRDDLAARFAKRFVDEPGRGYGAGAMRILAAIAEGEPWDHAAAWAFDGNGSMGNGAAMRVAPIGAYFADDLDRVVDEARASAEPTHAHSDGQAGAIAVAVATALAVRIGDGEAMTPKQVLREVVERTPPGPTRDGIVKAAELDQIPKSVTVAGMLGSGSRVLSADTVPYSLWCAAYSTADFESAMWTTVAGLGDRDTTCAIVGGIVALVRGSVPPSWVESREPLP